jgi:ABC-type transport system substrate-binding protein
MPELGRYTLVRQIGRGGMAEIWKAKVTGPQGFVKFLAIKTILPDLADDRVFGAMFVDEAKLAAGLVHPNLINVFDFGEIDGRLFLAMEYVAGSNADRVLGRLVKQHETLPVDVALFIALEACRGLGYAHAKTGPSGRPLGIVHRDISPHNILLSASGEVKVADFGIARAASAVPRTAAGHVRGKLQYMSPEQAAEHKVDARSDLFSLGVVLYELVTGKRLFEGIESADLYDKLALFDPATGLAAAPAGIRELLVVALQPERDKRYASAADFEAAIAKQLGVDRIAKAKQALAAIVMRLFSKELQTDAVDEAIASGRPSGAMTLPSIPPGPISGGMTAMTGPTVPFSVPPVEALTVPMRGPSEAADPPELAGGTDTIAAKPARPVRAVAKRRARWPLAVGAIAVVAGGLAIWKLRGGGASSSGPRRGGTLRIAVGSEVDRFDIFTIELSRTRDALKQVLESLYVTRRDGEVEDWLIERGEELDDGRRLVLHLRPNVMFHDHPCLPSGRGRLATGDDVAYSIQKRHDFQAIAMPMVGAGGKLAITADGLAVTIRLDRPTPLYRVRLAPVQLIPRELEGCEDLRRMKQPVGTGPFRFVAPPGIARFEMVRAPHYWRLGGDGEPLPYLDGIEVQGVQSMSDALARLTRGDLEIAMPASADWTEVFELEPTPHLAHRYASLPLDVAASVTRNRASLLGLFVTKTGPLADPAVRRAVAVALDRDALLPSITRRRPVPTGRFLEPTMLGYTARVDGELTHSIDTARTLLRDAGHPDGAGLGPITIGTLLDQQLAAAIAKQLAPLGLEVRVLTIPPNKAASTLHDGGVDALLAAISWDLYEREPLDIARLMAVGRDSPDAQRLDLAVVSTGDRAVREALYHQIEEKLLLELPAIPIAWSAASVPYDIYIVSPRVRGYHDPTTGYGRFEDLQQAWLAD